MSSFDDADTEETLTHLSMKLYHSMQRDKPIFQQIHFGRRQRYQTDEILKFGRDSKTCSIVLLDPRASRMQFSLQAFRQFNSTELCFEIKNVSRKVKMAVGNTVLDFLNKLTLPNKCLIRFGEFQILFEKEDGESVTHFETCFELARSPVVQEVPLVSSLSPVPETAVLNSGSNYYQYPSYSLPAEMDENESTYPL
ncbi:TRAF-interacting protein with FHA domain-containing protein A [Protopterus annectens]|uniref:TRAF-interacting protein with FHA domain-containing protein A n=1 Tax=Protopterus annectens TaxID=7888 RepID=UPI001CF9F28C|nr:TRAF-interacting protein with FHA domain-containing protein A [Protopterus annectens]